MVHALSICIETSIRIVDKKKQDTFFVCRFVLEKKKRLKSQNYFSHKIENETHGAHVNFWYYKIITVYIVI